MKALVIGEILWDIIDGVPHLGGAPLNLAAHLAKMGDEVTVLSAVGNDELGARALERAASFGIDTSCIAIDSGRPTGTVDVFVDDAGQPDYTIHEDVAYDAIKLDDEQFRTLTGSVWDVIYLGTVAQRGASNREIIRRLLQTARRNQLFYDVNLRKNCFTTRIVERTLLVSTMVKLNDDEADMLAREFFGGAMPVEATARRLLESFGLEVVIVTRGSKGAYLHSAASSTYTATEDVPIVDTVGAGDSFSAAFLHTYHRAGATGGNLHESGRVASALADFVVTRAGAIPDYPASITQLFS